MPAMICNIPLWAWVIVMGTAAQAAAASVTGDSRPLAIDSVAIDRSVAGQYEAVELTVHVTGTYVNP